MIKKLQNIQKNYIYIITPVNQYKSRQKKLINRIINKKVQEKTCKTVWGNSKTRKVIINMKRKTCLLKIAVLISFAVLCGCSDGTVQEQSKSSKNSSDFQQTIDFSNIYQEYCKDYKITDVSMGKKVTITAPDFEKIMQSVYENGTPSNIDSTDLENKIKEHPEMTKDYIFTVKNDSREQIEKKFYDMVIYDITITAYKNIDYSIEEDD